MTSPDSVACTWGARILPLQFNNGLASAQIGNWSLIVIHSKYSNVYDVSAHMEGAKCYHVISLKGNHSSAQEAINALRAVTGDDPFRNALEGPVLSPAPIESVLEEDTP